MQASIQGNPPPINVACEPPRIRNCAIAAERIRLGLRQRDLARILGWSRQTISAVEAGRRAVLVDELPDICRALRVTLDQLAREAASDDRRALGLDCMGFEEAGSP